ncbi:hypothetical protein QQM79_07765 [Marinobacteraceae bacterium S3BR75-40.1]
MGDIPNHDPLDLGDGFDIATALSAAEALSEVLAQRTHRKKVLGQEVVVPGQLGQALGLPVIINQLQGKTEARRQKGLEAFEELWTTLSVYTRRKVLDAIGWYDPEELDWDDPRSNRRPRITE